MVAAWSSPEVPSRPTRLPTRYVPAPFALAHKYGARLERMGAFLWRDDPLADAVVEALSAMPAARREPMVQRLLREGARATDLPSELRALASQLDHVPVWLDLERASRGGAAFLATGWFGGIVLALRSLVMGYGSPAGNKPLVFSGRLREDAPRRLAETSRFVQAVSLPRGMDRQGDGFAITVRVRLMHAKVRSMLRRSPGWQRDDWGEPINQVDMAGTVLLFSSVVLEGLRTFGFKLTADEAEDLMHLWRYVGYVIGVEEELLPTSEASGHELWEMLTCTQAPPDEDSRRLAAALLESPVSQATTPEERKKAQGAVRFTYALSRFLLGDEAADAFGYPRARADDLLHVLPWTLGPVHALARRVPFGKEWLERTGERHWQNVVREGLAGRPARFAMPDALAALRDAAKSHEP